MQNITGFRIRHEKTELHIPGDVVEHPRARTVQIALADGIGLRRIEINDEFKKHLLALINNANDSGLSIEQIVFKHAFLVGCDQGWVVVDAVPGMMYCGAIKLHFVLPRTVIEECKLVISEEVLTVDELNWLFPAY